MAFQVLTSLKDLSEGIPRVFVVEGRRMALLKRGQEVLAFDDVCTHDDGPLAEGELNGDVIECPRHGAQFNIRTGAVVRLPAAAPIQTYPVKIENEQVWVDWKG